MATPVGDSYSCPPGGVIAAGRHILPDWLPAAGKFVNISLNTLDSIKPAGWPTSDIGGPFTNWAGGVFAKYFSSLGAMVIYGSGHLSEGAPIWAGTWCFDLSTRLWVGRNVPAAPIHDHAPNTAYYNAYYESLTTGTEGHPYAPHTYDGLVYQPPSLGGGSKGALIRNFMPGATGVPNVVHQYDLSSSTAPPVRLFNDLALGNGGSYPMSAIDEARGGYWIMQSSGASPLKFVSFSDWSVSTYDVSYGTYGDNSLIYLPAPFDCVVGMGRANSENTLFKVFVCPIVSGVPQGFVEATTSGTPPNDGRSGGVWSEILKCIVAYQAGGSYTVHKLTPPSGSLTSGTWAWTSETLTAANAGETPSQAINTNNGLPFNNGAWSRFMEVKKARCFVWCEGVTQPVQAWRLTGM